LTTYAGYGPELRSWLEDAQINIDLNLRLQYLAGLDVHFTEQERIYRDMLIYRKLPADIFTGSQAMQDGLLHALTQ
jgi:spermidine synthase